MKELFNHKILNDQEKLYLIKKIKEGDLNARSILIRHNIRFVGSFAHKFENTGIPFDDLFSVGTIGLIKGIDTFNPEKNTKFATYVGKCIENEILMYLRRYKKISEVSLNHIINFDFEGNELTFEDILPTNDDILRDMELKFEKQLLYQVMETLPWRDKRIIELRFGLNNEEIHTQKKIGEKLEIQQSYVSRLIKKILLKFVKRIDS